MSVLVWRILNKHDYPLDKQQRIVETEMKQAKNLVYILVSNNVR